MYMMDSRVESGRHSCRPLSVVVKPILSHLSRICSPALPCRFDSHAGIPYPKRFFAILPLSLAAAIIAAHDTPQESS